MTRHPSSGSFEDWICPVTQERFGYSWTNHDKEGSFNECPRCAPKHDMTVAQRLEKLNRERGG